MEPFVDIYFEIHTTHGEVVESSVFNFDRLVMWYSELMNKIPQIAQYRVFSVPDDPNVAAIEILNKLFHALNMPPEQQAHFGVETFHVKLDNERVTNLNPQDVDHAHIMYTRTKT